MKLRAIELKGFKSFAQRTRIEFPPGISAIVGPNGCGKSNIIDAVRWVLGEQASGTLRAKRMEDVIFSGTEHRPRQNYAEVSLIFEDAQGMIEGAGEELLIRRILHRSGESIYSIGGKDVRLKDVRELLMDTGVGVSGYSLISQGDIEDILRETGFNRRKIFEEASGTSLLTAKKLEASRRLSRVDASVERISDIYLEVESRVEPLKEAAEKATQYLALKEQMEDAELYFALGDFSRYDKEAAEWQQQKKTLQVQLERLSKDLLRVQEENQSAIRAAQSLEEEHDALRARQREQMGERDAIFLELRLKEERRAQSSTQERQLKKLLEEGSKEREEARASISSLEEEAKKKETAHAELSEKAAQLTKTLQEKQSRLALAQSESTQGEERLREHREALQATRATQSLLSGQKDALLRSIDAADFDARELKEKEEELAREKQKLEKGQADLARRSARLEHSLRESRRELEEAKEELAQRSAELSGSKARLAAMEKEQELLESLETEQLDENIDPERLLFSHLKVSKGYERAVEAALGSRLRAVLASRETIFQGLRTGETRPGGYLLTVEKNKKKMEPAENALLHFVRPDKEAGPLLAELLGDVFVTESIESVEPKPGRTFVSKEGHILSGPYLKVSGKEASVLTFRARREEIQGVIQSLQSSILEEEKSLQLLASELQTRQRSLESEEEERRTLAKEEADLDTSLRENLHRIEMNRQKAEHYSVQMEKENARLTDVLAQLSEKEEGIRSLTRAIELIEAAPQEDSSALEDNTQELSEELHRLEVELARSEGTLQSAQAALEEKQKAMVVLDHRAASEEETLDELVTSIQVLQEEIDALRSSHSGILLKLEELDGYVLRLRSDLAKKREERESSEKAEKELAEKERHLTQEISSLEVKFVRVDERRKTISEDIWEQYNLSIAELKERFKGREVKTTRTELRGIRQSMLALEPVSIDAIEEYASVSEREAFLRGQLEDLKKAKEDLLRTLSSLERRMRGDFKKTFEEIRGHFQDIFRELFRGGEGDIRLEEGKDVLESDILILASPPGKKLVHMNLLSGGEKALTAIALLFAVLKAKPSPFYILDEIEAALDDVNIQRFGDFLMTFSEGSQFILITHRKGTMEYAQALYGVSMEEKGISTLVSLDLEKGAPHGRAI